jgi:uroporphyrinogen-III synthase
LVTADRDRPLAGRRVGVTRPEAGELGARLAALGATVVHVPLIEIGEPTDGGAALRHALQRLDAFDWLVVTSANGARRVGSAAAAHPAVRLAAVGPKTAEALADGAGRPVDLVATVPQAEGLLAEFPRPPARVLLAQADRARPVLADGLASLGHRVESVAAYRTAIRHPPADELVELAGVDAVVLASGSAATAWVEALGTDRPVVAIAIGPVTAQVVRRLGLPAPHVASSPDATSVLELLVRLLT